MTKLHQHLHRLGPAQASLFLKKHGGLLKQLTEVKLLVGSEYFPVISNFEDEFISAEQDFHGYNRPEDYLESFQQFIKTQLNQSAALAAVVSRPRDLTREQLKEVKLLLDAAGYSEANLQTAWRNKSNQDIAASIIGFIRQAAIGEALIPFEQRVQNAMQTIYQMHPWKPIQRKWLDRPAKQLTHEGVLDQAFINQRFSSDGGSKRLNKLLADQLDQVIDELNAHLWA